MKTNIKKTIIILFKHFSFYLIMPMLFIAIMTSITTLISSFLFKFIINVRGYSQINMEALQNLIKDPITIFMMLILLLFVAMLALIPYAFCFIIWIKPSECYLNSFMRTTQYVFKQIIEIIKLNPLLMLAYIIIFIPTVNIFQIKSVFEQIPIPTFILYELDSSFIFSIAMLLGTLILYYLNIRLIFVFCLFIDQKQSNKLLRTSFLMTKKHTLKILGGLLLITLIPSLIFALITLLIRWEIDQSFTLMTTHPDIASMIASSLIWLKSLLTTLFGTLTTTLCIGYIVNYYFKLQNKDHLYTFKPSINYKINYRLVLIIVSIIAISLNFILMREMVRADMPLDQNKVLIVAHRGSSDAAPENTIAAFKLAIEEKTDIIELDVHHTRDGQVIVYHDDNLKRLTGIDKKTIDLTPEELETITINPNNSTHYLDEHIPTLEETIKAVNGQATLMIEIKPNKETPGLEEKVVELIEKYNLTENVYVQSLDLDAVLKVKHLNPKIKVGYIMSYAISNYKANYTELDFFSIEQTSIKFSLIDKIRSYNKDIFVWTVDSRNELITLMDYNIKGVITNYPAAMRTYLDFYQSLPKFDLLKNFFDSGDIKNTTD